MLEEHLTEVLSEIEAMRRSANALQVKIEYYRSFEQSLASVHSLLKDMLMNIENRYERGLAKLWEIDGDGGERVLESLGGIAPNFARYRIEFPFGDIYSRPSLDLKSREIANTRTNQILAAHPDGKIDVAAEGRQTSVGAEEFPNGNLVVSNIAGGISLVSGSPRARTINSDLGSSGSGIVRVGTESTYVADYGGTTVNRTDRNGQRTVIADGLSSLVGLALTPDGSLTEATWGAHAAFPVLRGHSRRKNQTEVACDGRGELWR